MNIKEGREVEFEARVKKFLFDDFRTGESKYQVYPAARYFTSVYTNTYGATNITGILPELDINSRYHFKAVEKKDERYGPYYHITSVNVCLPKTENDKSTFLQRFLNKDRADRIIKIYPDFIDRVYNDKEVDITPIKGVGEKTYAKLKKAIKAEFQMFRLFEEFEGLFPYKFIKLFQEKINNGYTSKRIKNRLKSQPYKFLTSLNRVSFKSADTLILSIVREYPENNLFKKDILSSNERFRYAVEYFLTLESYRTGNTYFPIQNVKSFLRRSVIGITEEKIQEILSDKNFFVIGKSEEYISLKSIFDKEKSIYESVKYALGLKPKVEFKKDLEKYRKMGSYNMTDEQLSVIPLLMNNRIAILNGYAGTGKTDTINNVIRFMVDEGMSYRLMAPTGKAAKVLAKRTGKPASTIHIALACRVSNEEDMTFSFGVNNGNPFQEDVIIVDEASMIDTELMYHLLCGIDFNKSRLLLIGDDAQLPSVGPGNVFSVLKNKADIEKVELTKVFRFGDGGISTMATKSRVGNIGLPEDDTNVFTSGNLLSGIYSFKEADIEDAVNAAIKKYIDLVNSGEDLDNILLLTYKRKKSDVASSEAINPIIQSIINGSESFLELKKKETKFKLNDYVMQTRNDYHAFIVDDEDRAEIERGGCIPGAVADEDNTTTVTNGTVGRIVETIDNGLVIDFLDIGWIYVPYEKVSDIELAYCITIHKSQGSQADNVIMLSPRQHSFGMTSNLLYVGISRAKKNCYHYGNAKTINKASMIKEHVDRKTTLENFFLEKVNVS